MDAERSAGEIVVPIVVVAEIERGRIDALTKAATAEQVLRMQERMMTSRQYLSQFAVRPFNRDFAKEFEKLKQNKRLARIGNIDLQVAAIALAARVKVITRNVRDFSRIPGLQIENWT